MVPQCIRRLLEVYILSYFYCNDRLWILFQLVHKYPKENDEIISMKLSVQAERIVWILPDWHDKNLLSTVLRASHLEDFVHRTLCMERRISLKATEMLASHHYLHILNEPNQLKIYRYLKYIRNFNEFYDNLNVYSQHTLVLGCEIPSSTQDTDVFWSPTSTTHAYPNPAPNVAATWSF